MIAATTPIVTPDGEAEPVLQRARGTAEISFKQRDGDTVLDHLYQQGCAKLRLARAEKGRICEAVLINTSGGLTDGDIISTQAVWNENTCAVVTSQAAERYYKCRTGKAEINTRLEVSHGATGLWLPQEGIMFDGARYHRSTEISLAGSSSLVAVETTVFGRSAMGESVISGQLRESWKIRIGSRLIFADDFSLSGNIHEQLQRRSIANCAVGIATLIYRGRDTNAVQDEINQCLNDLRQQGLGDGGVSQIDELLIIRLFGPTAHGLRQMVVAILNLLLPRATGMTDAQHLLPRVWSM